MQEAGARQLSSTAYPFAFSLVQSVDHTTPATGKTPTVTIRKPGGAFGSPAGAVTEIGSGWYELAGNATDRNTLGELLIHVVTTGCDTVDRKLDIVGYDPFDQYWGIPGFNKLQTITSGQTVTFVSPVSADGTVMTLRAGDEYYNADGLAFSWTLSGWPSISGATPAVWTAKSSRTGAVLAQASLALGTLTILSATQFYVELGKTQTRALESDAIWDVQFTLSNGHIVTPVAGTFNLRQDATP